MTMKLRKRYFWPSVGSARLAVTSGPDRGKEIRWAEGKVYVGTHKSCDLVLNDPAVSRRHCMIHLDPEGAWIRDLESTNGTKVGHYHVRSAHLQSGSLLGLGRNGLQFETEPAPNNQEDRDHFGKLVGRSQPMRGLFDQIGRIALGPSPLLLQGETGTGKELVAETVHLASPRRRMPFLVFDCARVTPSLMASELFGHVRGAFTSARSSRPGIFEAAHKGSVFLDEIGELPLDVQPQLLRVLDRQQVRRLGASDSRQVDVRVIAATHRDLRAAVAEGSFRADLFYRLNVVTLALPPLRERGDDVLLLATHFLRQLSSDPQAVLPAEVVAELSSHAWPGNVRELRNAIERWFVFADPSRPGTTPLTLGGHCNTMVESPPPVKRSSRDAEADATGEGEPDSLARLIDHHGGSVTQAARAARMDRAHLARLLYRYKLASHGA